ncbi:MAG: major facilitator superfamily 1 transporter [Fibrobacteres bacterium]|nr:major facilitator superfamily 1 transporter [Fibrobacterota bacterium]
MTLSRIPRTVWALGLVSLFMDVSSEMVHSLLPLFLVTVLATSATRVGLIEGMAEGTALIVKIFSGALSDRFRNRKVPALIGYGLGAATKPLFALASTANLVFGARLLDRVGKGIRGAPRDALIADVTAPEILGAAYGLRQSLDTVGALLGPVLAWVLMRATGGDYRLVFWVAAIPGFLAVAILAGGVREPEHARTGKASNPIKASELKRLDPGFWLVTGLGSLLALARFSEAFLLLRGESAGMAAADAPILMMVMNVVYFLTAYPAGYLSDRIGRRGLLAAGILALIASDLVLAKAGGVWMAGAGAALWGLQMGLTQGIFSAFVAEAAPASLRGTAFGLFNLAGGIATIGASVIAGLAWDRIGPQATFMTGAGFALAALLGFGLSSNRLHNRLR